MSDNGTPVQLVDGAGLGKRPRAVVRNHNRGGVFRRWLVANFPARCFRGEGGGVVLDVAGGRGDIAVPLFLGGAHATVIVDPRVVDLHKVNAQLKNLAFHFARRDTKTYFHLRGALPTPYLADFDAAVAAAIDRVAWPPMGSPEGSPGAHQAVAVPAPALAPVTVASDDAMPTLSKPWDVDALLELLAVSFHSLVVPLVTESVAAAAAGDGEKVAAGEGASPAEAPAFWRATDGDVTHARIVASHDGGVV